MLVLASAIFFTVFYRQVMSSDSIHHRRVCYQCLRPQSCCYCHLIKPVLTSIKFIILRHPLEKKRKIATGRMAHLCLKGSELIEGVDFSNHTRVNEILNDSRYHCMMIYPKDQALDLSDSQWKNYEDQLFVKEKQLVLFVVDGTWSTAKKTVKQSQNLQNLPCVCFTPQQPSRFRVRKQPYDSCYSTIEAIHQVIDILEPEKLVLEGSRPHDNLIEVFMNMVNVQLSYLNASK